MIESIKIKGAKEHNLKNIDVEIPRDKLVVVTGLSGSGKSSLAFDTIYAEGQRRYVESLSAYARQFLGKMEKPDVEYIEGLSPAISIDQKTTSRNPRSTVGTVTEIYDYMRLLYARIGHPHCPECDKPIKKQSIDQMIERVMKIEIGKKLLVLSPVVRGRKGEYRKLFEDLSKDGYVRARVNGEIRELTEEIKLDRYKKHNIEVVVDRLVMKDDLRSRLTESMEVALKLAHGIAIIHIIDGDELHFSSNYACADCDIMIEEMTPRMFSFNNPYGACPVCAGLGTMFKVDPKLLIPDWNKSLSQGAVVTGGWSVDNDASFAVSFYKALSKKYKIDLNIPFKKLPRKHKDLILYGTNGETIEVSYERSYGSGTYKMPFEGIVNAVERRYKQTSSNYMKEKYQELMSYSNCIECNGKRLRKESLAVTVGGINISDMTDMTILECIDFIEQVKLSKTEEIIANQVLKEIINRLNFLKNVGLNYLSLNRKAGTLSGGEAQRIRLATQIGSYLMGVLYILDEPSIGLHQRDNSKLLTTLKKLRDLGNTLIIVEHDHETMMESDYIIDMGPGPGIHGGEVVAQGTVEEVMSNENSITGQYLSGKKSIALPKKRRKSKIGDLSVIGAKQNNLKNIKVKFPLGLFTCVSGVSGSGKSSLVNEIVYKALARDLNRAHTKPGDYDEILGSENLDKVIDIDQSPIGRTPRSNPATYTGTFSMIRDLFSKTQDARARGYKAGRFSFNVKGGRCEACKGDGIIKIEMHFLPDVYVTCEVCKSKRYNTETLEVKYKGKNIYEVLDMTVEDALIFFENVPKIKNKLQTLSDVGLDYIRLGQPSTQLSGGESQRIKLATELSKRSTGKTLYILDEPTTGLHTDDVKKLLKIITKLVDAGNTVIIIEHNLDVIKCADYIVDLGPEGGDKGGKVVAKGTPEEIAKNKNSYTGMYLKNILQ
ncbi:MAG: excinuclease ABC subunit UvrA [Clostridiales bacterium]|nr:excinuclease ABC subunit UvrA [Clostridiales bacterium]